MCTQRSLDDILPPPLDGTTTHCPHSLVHLVSLAREPNLVNLERREAVRWNLKVDLECTRRTGNLGPKIAKSTHAEDSRKNRTWRSKNREAPNYPTSACLVYPNEVS